MRSMENKKRFDKYLTLIVISGIVVVIYLLLMGLYFVSKWYDENRVVFNSPIVIKLQAPIRVEKRIEPMPTIAPRPQNKPEERGERDIVMSMPHGEILWKIYQLETQRGKTDNCRITNRGYAGFGVTVDGVVYCYPTFEKATRRAEYWFNELNPDQNLISALCQWNTGVGGLATCPYYQSYLSL